MKTLIFSILLFLTTSCFSQNLNSLSKAEYADFNKLMFQEFKSDPQGAGEKAKQIIIGMAGLETRLAAHKMFEVDVVFNLNSMLLLVANANKIKRQADFIDEYKKEAAGVEKQLTGETLTYHKIFTALVISENDKLP